MPPVPGCKCPSCWGAREFFLELTGRDYGLPAAPGHAPARLRVVTGGMTVEAVCTGKMTCPCQRCTGERQARLAEPPSDVPQPWEPRAARRAA